MPLFEYKCDQCGCVFDRLVSGAQDSSKANCPLCGEEGAHKQFAAFSTGSEQRKESCGSGCAPKKRYS